MKHPAPAAAPPIPIGADVVFAIDMSKSMSDTDVSPSRLEAVKVALHRFVATDDVDKIGIVVFSQQGKRLAGIDAHHPELEQVISSLRIGDIPELGTGIGDGLALAVDVTRAGTEKQQAVILISDGDYNWVTHFDPNQATAAAKGVKVVVYSVLIGTDRAGDVPTTNPNVMEHIAVATGGTFYKAADAAALGKALDDIQTKLRSQR